MPSVALAKGGLAAVFLSAAKDLIVILPSYFDKILVLTIPRLKERQEHVKQRLSGIDFEFFYGADKNELTEEYIAGHYLYDKKISLSISQQFKPLNKGEIACALSHRMIYQAMLDNKWERVLIFEDDVVATEHLDMLENCLRELPPDWELFYLGYLKNEKATLGRKIKRGWYMVQAALGLTKMPAWMIRNILPRPYSPSLSKAGFHDCTHAYAVTRSAAEKLLQVQTPVSYRADNLLSALVLKEQLNAFISKECLFNQEIFSNTAHQSEIRDGSKISV